MHAAAATMLALALLAAGCADREPQAAFATSDACPDFERPTLQDGGHLIGEQPPPVPYNSTPAASGWHSSGAPPHGVHEEALTDPEIVSVLHAGGVVAVYEPDSLDATAVTALEDLAASHDLTVTPYDDDLPTPLSVVGWGAILRCDEVDAATIEAFMAEFGGDPEDH